MGWLGDLIKGGIGLVPGGGLATKAVGLGLGALGAITGAKKGAQADKLSQRQLQLADERYAAGAPFRSKLQETAFAIPTQREDLSALFADPGNPYSRVAPRPLAQLPVAPPALPPAPVVPPQVGLMEKLKNRSRGRIF